MTTALTPTPNGEPAREQDAPQSAYQITPEGLIVTGTPTWDDYADTFTRLRGAHDSLLWCLGDLLNDGEARWGEMYAQVAEETGYDPHYLRNVKWVAAKYARHQRYVGGHLKWSHHRVLTALPAPDRDALLAQGEAERWTVQDFKRAISPGSRVTARNTLSGTVSAIEPGTGMVELSCYGESIGLLRIGQVVSLHYAVEGNHDEHGAPPPGDENVPGVWQGIPD